MGGMAFSAGNGSTLALKHDGSLWGWGDNHFRQLGIGEDRDVVPEPTRVVGDNWAAVACGPSYTVALKADGSLWECGGLINQPERVGIGSNWVALATGAGHHSMVLKADGSLWGWGDNSSGQLGLGNRDYTSQPTQVGADTDWKTVACGLFFTLAIKRDGSLWAWGDNDGFGNSPVNFVSTNVPTQFGTNSDWATVACGFRPQGISGFLRGYVLGIRTDGSLWGWGYNHYGQLGTGTFDNSNQPVRVGTDTNWAVVSCGHYHTSALKTDGTLWAWGSNAAGELGIGTTGGTNNSPVQVGAETDWTSVSCGFGHTVALKQEGSLWRWGASSATRTNYNRPLLINADTDWDH